MITKKFILFWIFTILVRCAFAQNELKGTVTTGDKQPIEGVAVYLPELRKGTTTDSLGKFLFRDIPTSEMTLQFSVIGYKTYTEKIDGSKISEVEVVLTQGSVNLQEISITANNTGLPGAIPFPVETVSQEEMKKYASLSVMGNLSYQPGVDKITLGNGIAKPVIRGLSFNRILLHSQGTRIENQQWDDHHDLGLTDAGVDHVEIVKGPAALIYGANATGGALIFVDEKPALAGTILGDINLGYASNTMGINGDAGIKGASENGIFYGVRAGTDSQTSYLQGEEGNSEEEHDAEGEEEELFAFNSKRNTDFGKINAGISKQWGVSKLSYSYLRQQIGIIEDESMEEGVANEEKEQREREMEAPYQDVTSHIISSENTVYVGQSKIDLNLAYQLNERKEYEPLGGKKKELAIGLDLNAVTYDVKYSNHVKNKLSYTLGSQGMFLSSINKGIESLVPDAWEQDFSGYGVAHYDMKKISFMGGIRVDNRHMEVESYEPEIEENESFTLVSTGEVIPEPEFEFEKEFTPFSFSLGTVLHPIEHFSVKINGATGFTAPNYAQLATFGKHEGTYRFEKGNPELEMEQNIEGDLVVSWESSLFDISVSAFANHVADYIYITNSGDYIQKEKDSVIEVLPLYEYVQQDALLTGGEITLSVHPESVKWIMFRGSCAMTKGELDKGGNLPYIPSDKLTGEVKLSLKKLWKFHDSYFSVVVSNFSEQKDLAEYELGSEGYTLLDLFIGSSLLIGKQKLGFNIYCTNLMDIAYYNQLSLIKNIGVRDMGRNIGVQLHIPFGIRN